MLHCVVFNCLQKWH